MYKKFLLLIIIILLLNIPFSFAENKVLKVGYYEDFPLVHRNENNEPVGFVIDLMNEIARNEEIEVEYVYGTWKEMLDYIESGEIDIVLDILKSERRDKIYDFTKKPLFLSWGKVCTNKKYKIDSILDLNDLTVGYLEADYYAVEKTGLIDSANEFELDTKFKAYSTYNEVLDAIEKLEVDAGIINKITINKIYKYDNIRETPLVFAASGIRVASKKGKNQKYLNIIDKYIGIWKEDKNSFYYKRYDYWFENLNKDIFKVLFYEYKFEVLLSVLMIFLIFTYSRMQVYFKTKEVNKTNILLEEINKDLVKRNYEINKAYKDIDALAEKFENLMIFLSKNLKIFHNKTEESFLSDLLREAMNLVKEADYGFVYNYDEKDELIVIDALNIKRPDFRNIKRKDFNWKDKNVFIVKKILNKVLNKLDNEDSKEQFKNQLKESKESLVFTFEKEGSVFGGIVLQIEKESKNKFTDSSIRVMNALKSVAESYFLNESFHKMNNIFQKEIIFSIIQMLEIHDEYTKGHSEAVANLGSRLAIYLGLSKEKADEIYWTGLVHDMGKILISRNIINKKGKLSYDEYQIIKKHPEFGYKALIKSQVTNDMAKYVLCHHERVDGSGYPNGLKGENISIESKIISLVDSYDAMTSERSYKNAMTKTQALEEIRNNLGKQFDKEIGLKFIEMMERS